MRVESSSNTFTKFIVKGGNRETVPDWSSKGKIGHGWARLGILVHASSYHQAQREK